MGGLFKKRDDGYKFEMIDGNDSPDNTNGFTVNTELTDSAVNDAAAEEKKTAASEIFEWLDVLATAIISVVIIFTLLFRVATIVGNSMLPTLVGKTMDTAGDKIIITNLGYTPKNGDIVVISRNMNNSVEDINSSDTPIIKRVIAVGGQTVDIDFEKGVVFVDGKELYEPFTNTPTNLKREVEFPVYVPEGYIFVMGDNRNDSLDSRSTLIGENGLIDTRYVLGHAVFRVFPLDKMGSLVKK